MPKTLKNVWERIIDVKNLDLAYKIPSEYSEDLEYIEKFNKRKPQRIKDLNENLKNKKYEVSKYIIDTVYEPKEILVLGISFPRTFKSNPASLNICKAGIPSLSFLRANSLNSVVNRMVLELILSTLGF